ncbi:MAG: MFS transporter [Sphingopyxis sp.]|nr:MFS transporter [Sphingopyxis sp.]
MASTLVLPMPTPSLALNEHRVLRITTLFLLYIAQGLPLGFINFALPGWLAQNGASAAAVGAVLAMANLPWTFKLAYGVVMDRWAFLAMGRRRPWIMFGQLAMIGTFAVLAFTSPAVQQVALITVFAFALGMGSAVQDVAVDGLAADILPENEIEHVNGVMFGGQMTGIAIGTGLGGTLIAYQGVPAAALALAAILTAILALAILALQSHWANPAVFIGFIFITEILRALRLVAGGSLAMRLCTPAIAATQFAVFMAVFNLGSVLGGLTLGWLDGFGGIPAMLAAAALCSFVGAGLTFTAKVER